jgi:putative inorganic carbon (HCO3(-)) transporter
MIYVGLLLFFFLEYIRPADHLMPSLAVLKLNTLVPLTIVLATLLSPKRIPTHNAWDEVASRLFTALVVLIVVSTVIMGGNGMTVLSAVVGYVLIYWVIVRQATDKRRIKGVFGALVLVHATLAAMTPEMFTDSDARHYLASGTFLGDGNDFALSVNVVIPLALFLFVDAPTKPRKILHGLGVMFMILCVIATRSRGGTLALLAVCAYYWLKTQNKLKTGLLGAVMLAGVLVVAPPSYFNRMDNMTNTEEGSAQGRIKAWNAGIWMAIRNPVLGAGAGNFARNWGKTAHSIYFLTLGELGLPGIALLVLIIGYNLRANSRLAKEIKERDPTGGRTVLALLASTSASLIAFASGGAFLSATYYPHMYIVVAVMVCARRFARENYPVAAVTGRPTPIVMTSSPWLRPAARQAGGGRLG